eukprot:6197625-Pleurochrysis_carterae.AAC.1
MSSAAVLLPEHMQAHVLVHVHDPVPVTLTATATITLTMTVTVPVPENREFCQRGWVAQGERQSEGKREVRRAKEKGVASERIARVVTERQKDRQSARLARGTG